MKSTDSSSQQRELTVLSEVAACLNGEATLKGVLEHILESTAALLHLETGWIWLMDEQTGSSYLAAHRNLPPALEEHPERMETQGCWCLDAFRKGAMPDSVHTTVVECSRLAQANRLETDGLRFHTSVPLVAAGQKLGLLNVASRHRSQLSAEDDRLLRAIGDLLSVAVERSRLFEASIESGAVKERLRLSREIHDSLGQGMTAVLLRLESLDAQLEGGSSSADAAKLRDMLAPTISLARQNLDEARRSVLDLRSAALEEAGLSGALQDLAAQIDSQQINVRWRQRGGIRSLPAHVETGLYRIAQEALNNAVQHARCGTIELTLSMTPGQVELVVRDDGHGFDPQQVDVASHHGLTGMTERARLLGADLQIQSQLSQGTEVRVTLLDPSEETR